MIIDLSCSRISSDRIHGVHYFWSDGDLNYLQAYKTVEYNLHVFSLRFLRCHLMRLKSRQGYDYLYMQPMESLFWEQEKCWCECFDKAIHSLSLEWERNALVKSIEKMISICQNLRQDSRKSRRRLVCAGCIFVKLIHQLNS